MRIVIVGPAYPLRGGGISSFNERLAYHFLEEGYTVDIYSFSLQYPNFLFPGKSQYSDEPAPEDLKIYSKINSINPINWYKVGRELKREKYDLLIVRFWMPFFGPSLGTILRQVRKNNHTKVVCIADNIVPHEKRWGDKLLAKYFLNQIDACVTMSQSVKRDLENIAPHIPNALCLHPLYDNYGKQIPKSKARKMLGIGESERIVLFFGFIRKYKGLDLLLEALAREDLKRMDVKLLLAGEFYGDEDFYLKKIEEFDLQSRVYRHTEFIPNSEVAQYFSAADCVVLPYRTATQSGITQVAYHFDLPMIVTGVGGLPELVMDGEVGWVVNPTADEIASGIFKFYSEDCYEDFRANIQKEKTKYSWSVLGDRILSFLK